MISLPNFFCKKLKTLSINLQKFAYLLLPVYTKGWSIYLSFISIKKSHIHILFIKLTPLLSVDLRNSLLFDTANHNNKYCFLWQFFCSVNHMISNENGKVCRLEFQLGWKISKALPHTTHTTYCVPISPYSFPKILLVWWSFS